MMNKVGIIGVNLLLGQELLKVLERNNFPSEQLLLFSTDQEFSTIAYGPRLLGCEPIRRQRFEAVDVMISFVNAALGKVILPAVIEAGCRLIDCGGTYRDNPSVPLVISGINEHLIKQQQIIAIPNCLTTLALLVINPLLRSNSLKKAYVTSFQAVSGGGIEGLEALAEQLADTMLEPTIFNKRIAFNVIPMIGELMNNGYTQEELRMMEEGKRILNQPSLKINCTCVRVPVKRVHSMSITMTFDQQIRVDAVREVLSKSPHLKLVDDPQHGAYPNPLELNDPEVVEVGRIRQDIDDPYGVTLFLCGDQLRRGMVSNAFEILQIINQRGSL